MSLLMDNPFTFALLIGFLCGALFIIFLMPRSAKVRLKSKFKKTGAIVTLCYDDGYEKDEYMQVDIKHGIFTKGDDTYIFTPNPVFIDQGQGKGRPKKEALELPFKTKEIIDEAVLKRSYTDTGKPHYIGLVKKGIAVTPQFLALIHKINKAAKEENIKELQLIEPQILKTYFRGTFSAATIQNIKFAAERRGIMRRPATDWISQNKLPIGIILIIIIVGYYIMKSGFSPTDLFGNLFGG